MAWIEGKRRSDGVTSYHVRWRLGGTREGRPQVETFGAGSDAQNRARAEGFQKMVLAAGEQWPEGWVKGKGFVRAQLLDPPARSEPERTFEDVGLDYVDQIVACSPGQRKRYRSQIRTLAETEVRVRGRRSQPFGAAIGEVTEDDVKAWLIGWDRSTKTKANYHGLLTAVFTYAMERGLVAQIPTARTAPKNRHIKQSQPDLRFLSEREFAIAAGAADADTADLMKVAVGTGARFGELTALWVSDVDLRHRTIRVNKAWKHEGENGEQDVPAWLRKLLRPQHLMAGHYLGNPKTPKSKRTIEVSDKVAEILRRRIARRAADDFVFVHAGGPLHQGAFYVRVWVPLMDQVRSCGVAPFRFHDLRHTHVAWLIAGGVPLPHIQARLGHESITTTIDTYGHLLPLGDGLISYVIDTALEGREIQPRPPIRVLAGGL